MQLVPVPLYSREMMVEAYLFRYQKGNDLFSTAQATGVFDGASRSVVLETVNMIGIDAFSLGMPVFIPISHIMLLGDLSAQCTQPPEKIIFLLEDVPAPEEPYLSKIAALREKGFRIAVSNLNQPHKYDEILKMTSFFFLSQRDEKQIAASDRYLLLVKNHYRELNFVATHIHSEELQKQLYQKGYALFESRFYSVPITQGADYSVSPLKANSIRLINTVQDENFDFDQVTEIVHGDPSLTISLLKLVNAPQFRKRSKVKTIAQAVALLGQKEVRKWVTTAVSQSLGDDRPNEITRISMVRAKFAENLAPAFEIAHMAQELFLMGLFSVLDIILELPMQEALQMVVVSEMIQKALLEQDGLFYPVLNLIIDYENASWQAVSRHMIVHDIKEDDLSAAYLDALTWYKNMTMPEKEGEEESELENASAPAE